MNLSFFNFFRLLKIDMDGDKNTKKKPLINLRDNLPDNKTTPNENIPRKLLLELASLPDFKYKIELKSKNQSLVLPVQFETSNETLKRKLVKYESDEIVKEPLHHSSFNTNVTIQSSPLDKDYITLKCSISNRKLALVPPIKILTPYTYPEANPIVECIHLDDFDDDMLPEYS
jgi:hypothetical protein